jgi:DNA polymerase-3 subunit delta'
VDILRNTAAAAASIVDGTGAGEGMIHAWLFTGPPGSGRSVAARAFAASLQCVAGEGCGECPGCRTTMAGTHADVRLVVPEGLSISVAEMRALVQTSARRPTGGRWQVVIIEDADRLTEGAANALLKAIEEPPARTVFLLCAPSDHPDDVPVTIRSRCRPIALRTPAAPAIAEVLHSRDGVDSDIARWAASVCGGHVGRARRLATDPAARDRRAAVLRIPLHLRRLSDVFDCADDLVKTAETDATQVSEARDEAEKEALKTAMGYGGTGKGAAVASRGSAGAIKELERRQKSRATRTQRDALDLALVDLAGFYRDVLVTNSQSPAALTHPDHATDIATAAASWTPESTLRRLEAVLACREAIELNVKPRIAVEAMLTTLHTG